MNRVCFTTLVLIVMSMCGAGYAEEQSEEATLTELITVDEMKDQFNTNSGKRRLLLLLSPT